MPAVGDQHSSMNDAVANPFEENKPRVSQYTAQEIALLQSRLEKQLGPEYISSRTGPSGQKVHYITAEKCIALANEVFGFNGWSSAIRNTQVDFLDENAHTGKVSLGLSVIVRVTLRDGTYHEDVGYGHIENCKGKAAAFEKAKKEGTTDALKRSLRNFGNVLGNCIYDKSYLAKVTKIKIAPTKFDAENLYRHSDYAPIKRESIEEQDSAVLKRVPTTESFSEFEDDLLADDFDVADINACSEGHPDEVVLDGHNNNELGPACPSPILAPPNVISVPSFGTEGNRLREQTTSYNPQGSSRRPENNYAPQTPTPSRSSTSGPGVQMRNMGPPPQVRPPPPINSGYGKPQNHQHQPSRQTIQNAPMAPPGSHSRTSQNHQIQQISRSTPPNQPAYQRVHQSSAVNAATPENPPVGFFSGRAAASIDSSGIASIDPSIAFNPKLESPSIRRTAGVSHDKSSPIERSILGLPPKPSNNNGSSRHYPGPSAVSNPNFINPSLDQHRRIGAPPGIGQSPLGNRNTYKPPSMMQPKQSANGDYGNQQNGWKRPPLNDVTVGAANRLVTGSATSNDTKRKKISFNDAEIQDEVT